jgi:DNA-binding response OmpR family regulator
MSARITVINEDQAILALYRNLLEGQEYHVDMCRIVFDHPNDIERLRPDLIVLDLKFGRQTVGWQMLEKLCLYRPTACVPLVVCTAPNQEAREQEGQLQQRGIHVVYKPFDLDDFLRVVNDSLTAHALPAYEVHS